MDLEIYLHELDEQFRLHADPDIARGQAAYMRNQFVYHGIKTSRRRELQKPFLKKENLPEKGDLQQLIKQIWEKPEREYQYFAQELVWRYGDKLQPKDIGLLEYMIVNKSWWDTVDFIATSLAGACFRRFPEQREEYVNKWLESGNIWLQRTALLFQLKYKTGTDTSLLATTIKALGGSREFFINKAIGWALREYSKTNPQWVVEFVKNTELSNLSRREGLRFVCK